VFADDRLKELLEANGIRVFSEDNIGDLDDLLNKSGSAETAA